MTYMGVRTCRTIRRLPEGRRFQRDVLKEAVGVAWDPQAGARPRMPAKTANIPVAVAAPVVVVGEVPSAQEEAVDAPAPAVVVVPTSQPASSSNQPLVSAPASTAVKSQVEIHDMTVDDSGADTSALSPARAAFLERDRQPWRDAVEQETQRHCVGAIKAGPVLEKNDFEGVEDLDIDEPE